MKIVAWLRRTVATVTLAATAVAFTASGQFEVLKLLWTWRDPVSIAQFRLRHAPRETFVAEIEAALREEDFDDARRLAALAEANGHVLPPDLVAATRPGTATEVWIGTRDFLHGAATGHVTGLASLGGTLTADYFVVGDIRDVAIHGTRMVRGEDYDRLMLGLAAFGLATVVPGSGPIDLGLSLVKTASRANRLSKPLRARLTRLASDLVDTRALGRLWRGERRVADDIARTDPALLRRNLAPVVRPAAAAELKVIARNTGELVSAGGAKTALRAMEHVDDVATDLPRFTALAKRMGDNTASVLRLFGKGAIRLGRLAWRIAAALIALLGWCLGLVWTLASMARGLGLFLAHATRRTA